MYMSSKKTTVKKSEMYMDFLFGYFCKCISVEEWRYTYIQTNMR